jgi:hypothetical protein
MEKLTEQACLFTLRRSQTRLNVDFFVIPGMLFGIEVLNQADMNRPDAE